MNMQKTHALVIVDPQNDFCDRKGSLYLEGAENDILRLARYIEKAALSISQIFVSLDSHDRAAVFHPLYWVNEAGERPLPFTLISHADFNFSKWRVASDANLPYVKRTFASLKAHGIEFLMVWPEHCVISTWGHQIATPLREALLAWQDVSGVAVRYIFKGENPYTDQFSIFEGVDNTYPETAFNETLYTRLAEFDQVTFAGEALTHCVKESIQSYVRRLGSSKQAKQELRLLTDCTSPVGGFDASAALDILRGAGVSPFVSTEPT